MADKDWPAPGKIAKVIGILFAGIYGLMLVFLILFRIIGQADVVAVPIVVVGLGVGVAYLAGRVNPMVRIGPSVLWVIVVVFSFFSRGAGDSTQAGAAKVLGAVILGCGLAYHVYVDAKVLVARSRSEAGDSY